MRSWQMFVALILGMTAFSVAVADEAVHRVEDDPRTVAAIRELVRRGAVVKRFTVLESETNGLLVRLKPEHLDREGKIDSIILATLEPLKELTVELRGVPLSDEGLKSLMARVKLVGLDVSGSDISDRGLQALASTRPQLRLLDLSFTRVSDEGLRAVTSQSELRHISLINCRVTDRSVASLVRLTHLREIYLAKTSVSSQATEQLRRKFPNCRIER